MMLDDDCDDRCSDCGSDEVCYCDNDQMPDDHMPQPEPPPEVWFEVFGDRADWWHAEHDGDIDEAHATLAGWRRFGFSPSAVAVWSEADVTLDDARKYRDAGLLVRELRCARLGEGRGWFDTGYDANEIIRADAAGYTPDQLDMMGNIGVDLDVAMRLSDLGWSWDQLEDYGLTANAAWLASAGVEPDDILDQPVHTCESPADYLARQPVHTCETPQAYAARRARGVRRDLRCRIPKLQGGKMTKAQKQAIKAATDAKAATVERILSLRS